MLPTLLRHLVWADRRTAAMLATLDDPPSDLIRTWAHLLAAEATWLARIEGRPPDIPVWPDLALADCDALMARNHRAIAHFADAPPAELGRVVAYRNSRGDEFRNTVAEILHQVAMHGMYHRGQVAFEVRRLGGEPQATDLIFHLRAAQAD
jgi:uncharacterized damage-inducible protein DinB